jgi:hypothetical protein
MDNGTLKEYVKTAHYVPVRDIPRLVRSHLLGECGATSYPDVKT